MTALAGQAQVQQGKGAALGIKWRAPCLNKAVMQIEPNGFGVLLIHVNSHSVTRAAGMIQQCAANTIPSWTTAKCA